MTNFSVVHCPGEPKPTSVRIVKDALCRFTASEVVLLGPAKVPTVKLYVYGESFMYNMIRHMVGMAVAVARGVVPVHYVPASLAMPSLCAYVSLPCA